MPAKADFDCLVKEDSPDSATQNGAPPPSEVAHPPTGQAVALLSALRPKQWTKNLFVLVALVFTNNLPGSLNDHRLPLAITALKAFLLFCAASSSVYLLNDVLDVKQDRQHPLKRQRAIASGRLSIRTALTVAALLAVGAGVLGFAINTRFAIILLAYMGLQLAYTVSIKHLVLLDVFAIATGFVFRAAAGGFAIGVPNSVWLLVCTLQLALFLGFGKRRHELTSLGHEAELHRKNLAHYTTELLDQLISIVLGGLTVSYAIYTIMSPSAQLHPSLVITLPNVLYGIFRYLYLIHVEHKGGSPESILLEDRPMQINMVLWLIEVIIAMHFQIHL